MAGTVWVVTGAPGAGKTTVAELLAARLSPSAALLDKDTVYGGFVAATLATAGRPNGEREGRWYDQHIKVHEYAGLAATTREIRRYGCAVVLVAPYTDARLDPAAWRALAADLGGDPIRLVWIGVTPSVLRSRLTGRASDRDRQKLQRFDEFVARMRPDRPPSVPHLAVVNDGGVADLEAALAEALASGPS